MRYRGKIKNFDIDYLIDKKIGDFVYDESSQRNYVWDGEEWKMVLQEDNDINFNMSNYDLNKMVYAQLKPLNETQLEEKYKIITEYVNDTNNTYYMLLCQEDRYYTLFKRIKNYSTLNLSYNIIAGIKDCLSNYGVILDIIKNEQNAIEIWVKTTYKENEEIECMVFFPYDQGVCEVFE